MLQSFLSTKLNIRKTDFWEPMFAIHTVNEEKIGQTKD